jgi:hypothetical protein
MPDRATDRLLEDSKNVGRWVAWDREQTRLLATGNTFEEAKLAAAATGERSVTLAKLTTSGARRKLRWAHVMAVFVAMTPSLNFNSASSSEQSCALSTAAASEMESDAAAATENAAESSGRASR